MVVVSRTGLLGRLAVAVGMLIGWAGHVAGQAPPTTGGVVVTPDRAHVNVSPSSSQSQTFTIKNTSSQTLTFRLRPACRAPVRACAPSSGTITLAAGASGTRNVTYTSGPGGSRGRVQLNAWVALADNSTFEDVGSVNVRSVATGFAVSVVDVNPGTTLERGLCLTVGVMGAASECGDLRIAHALPTTRTFEKARTPMLLYNSAHAHPYPLVAANVSVPIGTSMPDSVVAILRVEGVQRARQKWTGSQFPVRTRRRITLGFDGLNDATGVYAYTLEVSHWSGTTRQTRTVDGRLVIVTARTARSARAGGWRVSSG